MKLHRTDCLVIGAGLAGSVYALQAAKAGLSCELLSLSGPLDANSDWAQGGIIFDTSADTAPLARDILEAGDRMSNPAAIEQLVREGPRAVKEMLIDEAAVAFDRDSAGHLDLTREGGHAERRIIHSKDATGHAILSAVAGEGRRDARDHAPLGMGGDRPARRSRTTSPDPADKYHPLTCFGAYVLDTRTGEVSAIVAKKTVLACGGLGQIFLHSTNQPGSVGHGVAMAYRVGARLIDLEYVQFHPTVFAKKNAPRLPRLRGPPGRGRRPRQRPGRALHGGGASAGLACAARRRRARDPARAGDAAASRASSSTSRRCRRASPASGSRTSTSAAWRTASTSSGSRFPSCPPPTSRAAGVHTDLIGTHQHPQPERDRRDGLHRAPRREPPGEHLAPRVPDRRTVRGRRRRRGHRARRIPPSRAEPLGEPHAKGGPGADPPGHAPDPAHHVELRGRRPLAEAPHPRPPHPA